MASDVWMLSPDDTQEIDIIEAYGGDRDGGGYGADRLHLSHHIFIRQPFKDYQPKDSGSWYKDDKGTLCAMIFIVLEYSGKILSHLNIM